MDADAISLVFTLLVAGGLLSVATARFIAPKLHAELGAQRLQLAALVASGAMAGSLYYSERAGFTPCEFCWYQRIAMYPLAAVLVVAALRGDGGIRPYATTLAVGGAGLSIYHYQLQTFPSQGSGCSADASCTFRWIDVFGFVSIPLLALGCFALILMLLWTTPGPTRNGNGDMSEPDLRSHHQHTRESEEAI